MTDVIQSLKFALKEDRLVALVTVLIGANPGGKLLVWPDGRTEGDLGSKELNQQAARLAGQQLEALESGRFSVEVDEQVNDLFIEVHLPLPKLVIIGAVHIAVPLVSIAKVLGFHTIVIDARRAFATEDRFPHADQLIVAWPTDALKEIELDQSTSIVTLTHDEKFDVPVLSYVIQTPVRYIGVLGSVNTHAKRVQSLLEYGVTDEQIARIHGPVGLDIGAKSVEEIALSIMAEIVAVMHGRQSIKPRQPAHAPENELSVPVSKKSR